MRPPRGPTSRSRPDEGDVIRTSTALVVLLAGMVAAAAAQGPLHWTAKEIAEIEQKIAGAVDPARHLGLQRLLEGATLIHRDGPSEAEVHLKLADFITVRSGEGE